LKGLKAREERESLALVVCVGCAAFSEHLIYIYLIIFSVFGGGEVALCLCISISREKFLNIIFGFCGLFGFGIIRLVQRLEVHLSSIVIAVLYFKSFSFSTR
jgi:hypothetical protein